jgi:hypothetical protein
VTSDYHDFVQLPTQGQVTPTNYTQGGVLTTVSSPGYIGTPFTSMLATAAGPGNLVAYIYSTQDNNQSNLYLSNYAWQTTVASSYSAPGSRTAV